MTEKLEHVWSCPHTLSKPWEKFYVIHNIIYQKYEQTQCSIYWFFCYQFDIFLCGSYWWRITWRYGKQNFDLLQLIIPEIMRILLSFFIFSYLQWTMITTKPTSTLYCYLLCPLGRCPYMSYSVLQSLLHLYTLDTFFHYRNESLLNKYFTIFLKANFMIVRHRCF